jgi:hypothetical protein
MLLGGGDTCADAREQHDRPADSFHHCVSGFASMPWLAVAVMAGAGIGVRTFAVTDRAWLHEVLRVPLVAGRQRSVASHQPTSRAMRPSSDT